MRVKIEHGVGEAFSTGGFTVVNIAWLQQYDLAGHAVIALATTVKALHALLGKAHQVTVVPVWVISVAIKVRANGLNAGISVLLEINPVACTHVSLASKKGRGLRITPW